MRPRLALRRRISIAATSALVVALCGHARAQNAEAESLFEQGNKLMKKGELAEACDAFEASNRIESRAGTLIKLGECREQNHQLASAWSAYKDALARVKDPRKQKIASDKIAELEPKLSYMTLNVTKGRGVFTGFAVTRNGQTVDEGVFNHAVPIDGGQYLIIATEQGHESWQTKVEVPNAGGKVTVTVPALAETAKPAPPPQPVKEEPPEEPPPPASSFTARRKAALAIGGVGLVAIGVGALLGVSAKSKQDDAYKLCPDPAVSCASATQANDLISSGQSRALGANIAFGVGGAAVIGAAVLWLTGAPESRGVALVPSPSGAALVGRF